MSVLSPMLFSFLNLNTCKAIRFNNWIRDLAERERELRKTRKKYKEQDEVEIREYFE